MITPTHHEKAEWSRLATDAYRRDRNDVGHRFSVAASLPSNGQMAVRQFDSLQEQYRGWLLTGEIVAPATSRKARAESLGWVWSRTHGGYVHEGDLARGDGDYEIAKDAETACRISGAIAEQEAR